MYEVSSSQCNPSESDSCWIIREPRSADAEVRGKMRKILTLVTKVFHRTPSQLQRAGLFGQFTLQTCSDKWKCQTKVKHGFKAALRRVLHVRWAHIYLARLSWWLSWLGSCRRLPPGSPGPRVCRWRLLEGKMEKGEWRTRRGRTWWKVERRRGQKTAEKRGEERWWWHTG